MALLDRKLLEAVVLFEEKKGRKYQGVATGFLIGFKAGSGDNYHTFLITNKHVVSNKNELFASLDILNGRRQRLVIQLVNQGRQTWFAHRYKDVDLALLPISMPAVTGMGAANKWIPEDSFLYFKDYEEVGFALGDMVFFMGFPLGLSGKFKNAPIVRTGSLARADSELMRDAKALIIDGQNFPGNSGGPVFTRPELGAIEGYKSLTHNHLVGVVKSYLPHTNYFVDPSNGAVSAISVENSGLALYVPMDYAKQIYNAWLRAGKPIIR